MHDIVFRTHAHRRLTWTSLWNNQQTPYPYPAAAQRTSNSWWPEATELNAKGSRVSKFLGHSKSPVNVLKRNLWIPLDLWSKLAQKSHDRSKWRSFTQRTPVGLSSWASQCENNFSCMASGNGQGIPEALQDIVRIFEHCCHYQASDRLGWILLLGPIGPIPVDCLSESILG